MLRKLILASLIFGCHTTAADIAGPASVIDGDTLEIGEQRIRFYGIDAPESTQYCKAESGLLWPCGQRTASNLADYIGSSRISCAPKGKRWDGSVNAVCFRGRQDLGAWLVLNGWAAA